MTYTEAGYILPHYFEGAVHFASEWANLVKSIGIEGIGPGNTMIFMPLHLAPKIGKVDDK